MRVLLVCVRLALPACQDLKAIYEQLKALVQQGLQTQEDYEELTATATALMTWYDETGEGVAKTFCKNLLPAKKRKHIVDEDGAPVEEGTQAPVARAGGKRRPNRQAK
eukprot:5905346-Alexandrium_andersonii.AAC.1